MRWWFNRWPQAEQSTGLGLIALNFLLQLPGPWVTQPSPAVWMPNAGPVMVGVHEDVFDSRQGYLLDFYQSSRGDTCRPGYQRLEGYCINLASPHLVNGVGATLAREDAMDRRAGFALDYYVAQGSSCRPGFTFEQGFCVATASSGLAIAAGREDAMDQQAGYAIDYYASTTPCRDGYSDEGGFCVDSDGEAPDPDAITALQAINRPF